jgi:hypothetical protein
VGHHVQEIGHSDSAFFNFILVLRLFFSISFIFLVIVFPVLLVLFDVDLMFFHDLLEFEEVESDDIVKDAVERDGH